MPRVVSKGRYLLAQVISISGKNDAVLEMPYKLMISVVILTLTIPIIFESTEDYIQDNQNKKLQAECEYLAGNIKLIYQQGTGAEKKVELNLPDSTEFVSAGGNFYKDSPGEINSIRFKIIEGEQERIFVNLGITYIAMRSPENGTFSVERSGVSQVIMKKCLINEDLNTDGVLPDFYVELSLI